MDVAKISRVIKGAEWFKALLKREKINENPKIPDLIPGLGYLSKNLFLFFFSSTITSN